MKLGVMRPHRLAVGVRGCHLPQGPRRWAGVSRAVVIATRRDPDGGREVLGLDLGDSEDGTLWTAFLRSLTARRLAGVQLIISNGALISTDPRDAAHSVPDQRCLSAPALFTAAAHEARRSCWRPSPDEAESVERGYLLSSSFPKILSNSLDISKLTSYHSAAEFSGPG